MKRCTEPSANTQGIKLYFNNIALNFVVELIMGGGYLWLRVAAYNVCDYCHV